MGHSDVAQARNGGLTAEEHGLKLLRKRLEKKDRAWERAEALERANLEAAKDIKMEQEEVPSHLSSC